MMGAGSDSRARTDAACGAMVADGCFCLAFTLHLLSEPVASPTIWDFIGMGIIFCVFLSSCWVIYDAYWQANGGSRDTVVKKLRIKDLEPGAPIEYDGKSYRIDAIDRANGEILLGRVGQPGRIIVQIEGPGKQPTRNFYGQ